MSAVTDFKESLPGRVLVSGLRFADQVVCLLWTGRWGNTLSAYLGATSPDCRLCRWLSRVEDDHCRNAARAEGLL